MTYRIICLLLIFNFISFNFIELCLESNSLKNLIENSKKTNSENNSEDAEKDFFEKDKISNLNYIQIFSYLFLESKFNNNFLLKNLSQVYLEINPPPPKLRIF